jgi:hypothetical protein
MTKKKIERARESYFREGRNAKGIFVSFVFGVDVYAYIYLKTKQPKSPQSPHYIPHYYVVYHYGMYIDAKILNNDVQ